MAIQPAIARELSKLGQYYFLDWTAYMEFGAAGKNALEKEILRASKELNPDITFFHVQRAGVVSEQLFKQLNGTLLNYTYDVALPIPEWYYEVAPYCVTIFCDENGVRDFRLKGLQSEFALSGYDDEIFNKTGKFNQGEFGDIIFMGNVYDKESQPFPLIELRNDMVDFLKTTYREQFKVYGNGWKYNDGNFMFRENKEAEAYRSCKIGINISHFDLDRYTSDRMFRIMGSGAMCLTKWYPGIETDFVDGLHLKVWRDFDELKKLIDYYLEHEDERKIIAEAGNKYVNETSTWKIRMSSIINYGKNKQGI